MSKEVINVHGQDVVVREDTAKAFRWLRFETILLSGIILLFILVMIFFSGLLTAVDKSTSNANTPATNTQSGP